MSFGIRTTLDAPFEEVLTRVPAALTEEGFGVLTEIDVQDTLRKKLGVETRRYRILGACNPPFAHQALELDLAAGLVMPFLRPQGPDVRLPPLPSAHPGDARLCSKRAGRRPEPPHIRVDTGASHRSFTMTVEETPEPPRHADASAMLSPLGRRGPRGPCR